MKVTPAALACCIIGAVVSCSTGASATPTTEPTAEPTSTTPPTVVSVEDVRALSGISEFQSNANGDRTTPQADPNAPDGCRGIYDPSTVFSPTPLQFRGVVYDARIDHPVVPELAKAVQEVGVYSDHTAAQEAFDRVRDAIPACSAADVEYYNKPGRQVDASTLLFDGDSAAYVIRVAGDSLIRVSVLVPTDDERIAVEIADRLGAEPR